MCFEKIKQMITGKKQLHEQYGEQLLLCPRCSVEMEKIKKGEVIIDLCKHCNGMWLDDNEINKLVSLAKKQKNRLQPKNRKDKIHKL
ncbi:zf-TFIIB domain-containing protein [Candidatus Woesearchaeota archaeon]|nr:zf-TFIIB domain-containing protein [Candidatus Woesearchaeota archaeon]